MSKRIKYKVTVRVPTNELSTAVRDLQREINETMGNYGFRDQKLVFTTDIPATVSTNRELTKDEKARATMIIREEFRNKFGDKCEVVSFLMLRKQ